MTKIELTLFECVDQALPLTAGLMPHAPMS
jgi:hypothetical protein